VTSYEKLKLRCEVAEKGLAYMADPTPANEVAALKAVAAYDAATNDVGSAVAKALLGRKAPVNLLADDSVKKARANGDPDDEGILGITERVRLRKAGKTARPKTTLNTAQADLEKPIPKLNMGPYDLPPEEG
jgi:hypothetical protein